MNSISSIAKSGAWNLGHIIGPATVALPLAIQGACLIKNIIKNPSYLKNKVIKLKTSIMDGLTRRPCESVKQAVTRIAKNVFIFLTCATLMGAAAYFSIHLLPAAMGIATAISAIFLIGKLFLNAGSYKAKIIDAFTARPGEDPAAAKRRIRTSIFKTVALGIITGAAITLGAYILVPLLHEFSWSISLPYQTKLVVFFEYAALGILHTGIAIAKFLKGDKKEALFHIAAAAASIALPIFYWNHEMRLHHSFYGLALMALPSRTAKIIGTAIALDSCAYMIAPLRGGMDALGQFVQYDFINVIADHFALFYAGYTAAAITENINSEWKKPNRKAEVKPEDFGLTSAPINLVQSEAG